MIESKPLPYDYTALEPYMSAVTLHYHHDGHYLRYVRRLNELTHGMFERPQDAYMHAISLAQTTDSTLIREQAAQVVAHEAFFANMLPPGARDPRWPQHLRKEMRRAFATAFEQRWLDAAMSVFGSGWVYLCAPQGRPLQIVVEQGGYLLRDPVVLTMDAWEHAYYLDHPDDRATYVKNWVRHLADWSGVAHRIAQARSQEIH